MMNKIEEFNVDEYIDKVTETKRKAFKTKYKTVSDLYCNHHSSYNHCNH